MMKTQLQIVLNATVDQTDGRTTFALTDNRGRIKQKKNVTAKELVTGVLNYHITELLGTQDPEEDGWVVTEMNIVNVKKT